MRYLKIGDPCPLCGQPIKTTCYEKLEILSCVAWLKNNALLPDCGDDEEEAPCGQSSG